MVERLTAVAAEAVGDCVLVELVAGRMSGNTVVGVLAAVSAPDTVGPAGGVGAGVRPGRDPGDGHDQELDHRGGLMPAVDLGPRGDDVPDSGRAQRGGEMDGEMTFVIPSW